MELNTHAKSLESTSTTEPTPDGLGKLNLKGMLKNNPVWIKAKAQPTRTADAKNAPGTDYASKITQRNQKDFNEIHTDANGDFWLYNHKADKWDIKGDSAHIPYYEDLNGDLWAYNIKSGAWDVPVSIDYEAPLKIEEGDNVPCDEGDNLASAIA
jgi:hypothetical protein